MQLVQHLHTTMNQSVSESEWKLFDILGDVRVVGGRSMGSTLVLFGLFLVCTVCCTSMALQYVSVWIPECG